MSALNFAKTSAPARAAGKQQAAAVGQPRIAVPAAAAPQPLRAAETSGKVIGVDFMPEPLAGLQFVARGGR